MPTEMVGRLFGTVADFPQKKLGVLCDLSVKLSGEFHREWLKEIKRFLRKEPCWTLKVKNWRIWRNVKLGTFSDIDSLVADLARSECELNTEAWVLLKKITLARMFREIEITLVTPESLGFKNGATLRQILERAIEMGLELCPEELGPRLALDCLGQPLKEPVLIAMDPIANSRHTLSIFMLERDLDYDESREVLWLKAEFGELDTGEYYPDDKFVFVTRGK